MLKLFGALLKEPKTALLLKGKEGTFWRIEILSIFFLFSIKNSLSPDYDRLIPHLHFIYFDSFFLHFFSSFRKTAFTHKNEMIMHGFVNIHIIITHSFIHSNFWEKE